MASYDIIILLLGPARSGKTTFANTVAEPVDGSPGGSNTTTCKDYKQTISGKNILLIDTPGLDDSPTGNLAVLNTIAERVSKPPRINAVIYFHQVTNTRLTGSARSNIEIFCQICGTVFFAQTAFVTTMWNTLSSKARPRFDGLDKQLQDRIRQRTSGLTKHFKFDSKSQGSGLEVLRYFATLKKISGNPQPLQLAQDVKSFGATPSGVRKSAAGKQILKDMNKGLCVIV